MKTRRTLTLLFGVILTTAVFGQELDLRPLTKKEKKEWRKRKKAMSSEEFRKLVEENTALKVNIASAESEADALQTQISVKDVQLIELENQLKDLLAQQEATLIELENLRARQGSARAIDPNVANSEDWSVGIVFKVQVGAFRKIDLDKYAKTGENFDQEDIEDLRKYILGNFRNYEDANVLKRYLREMGVLDAWIVPYKDNRRVPLKEVLDDITKGGN